MVLPTVFNRWTNIVLALLYAAIVETTMTEVAENKSPLSSAAGGR